MTAKHQILYCQKCGWAEEGSGAGVNECPNCQKRGLSFVRFTEDEREEAEKIVSDACAAAVERGYANV
jgi:hypothetical protein